MPDVTRVSRFGFVNAYLVREDDGLTLIDTTLPRAGKRILSAAADLGAPIRRIALTHAHTDHVGALDELAVAIGGVEVIIGARDARLLEKDTSLEADEPQVPVTGSYKGTRTRPTRTVVEGDTIGSLQVIFTPGHTPGHVAFLDTRDDTLYCGDTFTTLGGVSTSARPNPRFPLPAMASWHRPSVLESARRLRALEPARLASGHGKVVSSPLPAMDAAIARGA